MRRRLLNLLTILALIGCVVVAAAWVRGYWTGDVVLLVAGGTSRMTQSNWVIGSGGGGLGFVVTHGSGSDVDAPGQPHGLRWRKVPPLYAGGRWSGDSFWNRRGFYWFDQTGNSFAGIVDLHGVVVPAWFVFLLATSLPAARLLSHLRRWRRYRAGTCRHCGYDLRASPGRCPECGGRVGDGDEGDTSVTPT
jgi:hypothetical protein